MRYSAALTTATFDTLATHLLRTDRQEDLCFALWYPSTGANRQTAMLAEPIPPFEGERRVHWNASFLPHYLDRALEQALAEGAGLALLHSHLGPGWQEMSSDDVTAEQGNAAQVLAATGLPLIGLTIATDGALSARFWIRTGAREYVREWCESVRVVGDQFQITFDERQRPPPEASKSQLRTVTAWGPEIQARVARLHVGIIGAGSVGSIVAEALARIGIPAIRLIDFDSVEEHNLDRLLHAGPNDIGKAKAQVLAAALQTSPTAAAPEIEALEWSVCETPGFEAALDCDILFSCVDRPWPRKAERDRLRAPDPGDRRRRPRRCAERAPKASRLEDPHCGARPGLPRMLEALRPGRRRPRARRPPSTTPTTSPGSPRIIICGHARTCSPLAPTSPHSRCCSSSRWSSPRTASRTPASRPTTSSTAASTGTGRPASRPAGTARCTWPAATTSRLALLRFTLSPRWRERAGSRPQPAVGARAGNNYSGARQVHRIRPVSGKGIVKDYDTVRLGICSRSPFKSDASMSSALGARMAVEQGFESLRSRP